MFTALIPPQIKITFPRDQKSKLLYHNNHPSLFFSGNVFSQMFKIGWFEPCVWRAATPSLKMCWKFTSKSRENGVTDELRRAATSSWPPSARWLVLEGEEGVFHYLSRSPPTLLQAPPIQVHIDFFRVLPVYTTFLAEVPAHSWPRWNQGCILTNGLALWLDLQKLEAKQGECSTILGRSMWRCCSACAPQQTGSLLAQLHCGQLSAAELPARPIPVGYVNVGRHCCVGRCQVTRWMPLLALLLCFSPSRFGLPASQATVSLASSVAC